MISIVALWEPILLSAIFVFVASSLIHMVLGYHANDLRKLPDENSFANALRQLNIPPGEYIMPRAADSKEMRSPEFKEKMKKSPAALLTLWAGPRPSMAVNLVQWFLFSVMVGVFAAYVAGRALQPGVAYLAVFRFVGVTAFCCYTVAGWQESIWYGRAWSTTFKSTFDGLIYALLTGGTFGWLWPQ